MNVQKYRCKKDTIRWTNQGSKKDFFQLFLKSPRDILRGLILNRLSFWGGSRSILRSFFGRLFFDIWKWSKIVENGSGVSFGWFLGRPEADFKGGR